MNVTEKDVFVVADNIVSPLGKTTTENFGQLIGGVSAVKEHHNSAISTAPFFAAMFDTDVQLLPGHNEHAYTKFEQLLISSISGVLQHAPIDMKDKDTVLIISSTKGNIGLLESEPFNQELRDRMSLSASAKIVAEHFGYWQIPIIISNACISGVLAIITAMRLLRSSQYQNAVIAGADVISKFILSGFQSFQALSPQQCKPFDQAHDGLNLGEGAGTIILSTNEKYRGNIRVKGGSVSNDANHISGPSRTGQELATAIANSLTDAGISAADVDFISAHGTATVYNDEMEANAFNISGLRSVSVNSLKGYYGHTLGAAGLIESIVSIHSMREKYFLPTMGFSAAMPANAINVCSAPLQFKATNVLKTASGFGGCNAAVVFGE